MPVILNWNLTLCDILLFSAQTQYFMEYSIIFVKLAVVYAGFKL